ncbi:MAG: phosphatidate cytidylyltransferase [Saprospiraceae bacterium]
MSTRIVSALIFGILMIGVPLLGYYPTILLYLCITFGAAREWFRLESFQTSLMWSSSLLITLPLVAVSWLQTNPSIEVEQYLLFLIPVIFFLFLIGILLSKGDQPIRKVGHIAAGWIYIGFSFACIPALILPEYEYQPQILLGILLLTWSNDSLAYFIGSAIGKNPLFKAVSPNKTLEGSFGGIIGTFIIIWIIGLWIPKYFTPFWWGMALICAVFGTLGDLVESMFKRHYQVKDTGNIMPGHGGLLDRFDAMILILPFATIWKILYPLL